MKPHLFRMAIFLSLAYISSTSVTQSSAAKIGDETKAMQAAVSYSFLDPDSAKFRNIRRSLLGYCGEVNAKNSFGAYVGYKPFHAAPNNNTKEWIVSYEKQMVNIFCEEK